MVKAVMTLAVPGILLYMENHLCIAVVVKNPRSRMIGMEPVYLEQYWAMASKSLKIDT